MNHPDKPAAFSVALPGAIQNVPDEVISVVVSDENGDPVGVLEKWYGDAWFYADADSLRNLN